MVNLGPSELNYRSGVTSRRPEENIHLVSIAQRWQDVVFLHWSVEPGVIQRTLPQPFVVDTFDDKAWLSLVMFRTRKVMPFCVPTPSRLSDYNELNVRTYVRGPKGEDGIWFYSLSVTHWPVVAGGRSFFGQPFRMAQLNADVTNDAVTYDLSHRATKQRLHASTHIGDQLEEQEVTDRDVFLTTRWRAWSRYFGMSLRTVAAHQAWPLRRGEVVELEHNLLQDFGIFNEAPALVHVSEGVDARLGFPVPIR